jgi:hypothetical protein
LLLVAAELAIRQAVLVVLADSYLTPFRLLPERLIQLLLALVELRELPHQQQQTALIRLLVF